MQNRPSGSGSGRTARKCEHRRFGMSCASMMVTIQNFWKSLSDLLLTLTRVGITNNTWLKIEWKSMNENEQESKVFIFPPTYSSPELDQIFKLAYTIDGYGTYGEDLGKLANGVAKEWHSDGVLPIEINLLRSSLFYEARRARFVEGYPHERDMPYLRALATEINKGLIDP